MSKRVVYVKVPRDANLGDVMKEIVETRQQLRTDLGDTDIRPVVAVNPGDLPTWVALLMAVAGLFLGFGAGLAVAGVLP